MKWRYLKKYYGRLSLRCELVYVFRYICRQLRLSAGVLLNVAATIC